MLHLKSKKTLVRVLDKNYLQLKLVNQRWLVDIDLIK